VGFGKCKAPFNSLKKRQEIVKAFLVPGRNSFPLDRSVCLRDDGPAPRRPAGPAWQHRTALVLSYHEGHGNAFASQMMSMKLEVFELLLLLARRKVERK
jgi:hypothetical protein